MLNSRFSDTSYDECGTYLFLKTQSLGMLYSCIHQSTLTINSVPMYFSRNSHQEFGVHVFLETLSLGMQCLCSSQDTHSRNEVSMYSSSYSHQECDIQYLSTHSYQECSVCISWDTLTQNAVSVYLLGHSHLKCGVYVSLNAVSLGMQCLCASQGSLTMKALSTMSVLSVCLWRNSV